MFEVQAPQFLGSRAPQPANGATGCPSPALIRPSVVHMAKWPPDNDGGSPAGGGYPGGGFPGGFDPGDSNFKKGKVKPLIALLLVGLVAAGGALFLGVNAELDKEELTPDKVAKLTTQTLMLTKAEQLPKWESWASDPEGNSMLKEEALKQLAWARDPRGVDAAIAALTSTEEKLRAQAATALAEYGLPDAEKARGPLLAALKEAKPESKPQIGWALVELHEAEAFDEVMNLYRAGHLSQVKRLDGAMAFNPYKIVELVSLDKFAELHTDESPSVRQLVATVLSRNPSPKYTDALIALVNDKDRDIAAQAAPGLGKIGDERARKPLIEQLSGANVEEKKVFLEALRDGIGASGLVLALESVSQENATKTWHQTQQIFKMIRDLADPKGVNALTEYLGQRGNHIHWQVEAAFALAEIGDVGGVPTLAARLRMDEQKIYSDETDYEMMLKRDNKERVTAARMLADLAVIHPDKREILRDQAEDALMFWINEMVSPHANGLRALATMESKSVVKPLRAWANPRKPLPLEGQQPPMPEEWVVAQSAMRYAGMMKDKATWPVLVNALQRRPEKADATMESLMSGGMAILGMSLRAIGVGAAHGFSEWGDHRAFKPLMDYIEEPKENEQSRMEACSALAWVAEDDDFVTIAEKIKQYSGPDPKDQVRQACLLESLITRPIAGTSEALIGLLVAESAFPVRHAVARAIGKAGIEPSVEAQLFEKLKDEKLMNDAALALMLGGNAETAARALAALAGQPKESIDELQELWFGSFGYWSNRDLDEGHIFRYVQNAEAASRIEFDKVPQGWVAEQLRRQFHNLQYDNGPHSFTRVVLRHRLLAMALGDDAAVRAGAVNALRFMQEQGALLALRDEQGEVGKLAQEAYHRLRNPTIVLGTKEFKSEAEE
jgi:HEAT repeat protein